MSKKLEDQKKLRDKCLKDAITYIKSKGFGYIKFELEATLARKSMPPCTACKSGNICTNCDGTGAMDVVDNVIEKCPKCKNGIVICGKKHLSWGLESVCQSHIMGQLPQSIKNHLVYKKFYYDGSVDSELTFTLPIEHVKDAIKITNAFASLADHVGQGLDTRGAGMHIALLNSKNGNYPYGNSLDNEKTIAMSKQMAKLMPALFFLGASDHISRKIHYRFPRMSTNKYSAINTGCNVLEYRVFETCYRRPEMLLEFVEVIAKTLVFYDTKIVLPKKLLNTTFIFKAPIGNTVQRFYTDPDTYKMLETTLSYLKPESRSIEQLKAERSFYLNEAKIKLQRSLRASQAIPLWREYSERRDKAISLLKSQLDRKYMIYVQNQRYYDRTPKSKEIYLKENIDNILCNKPVTMKQFIKEYVSNKTQEEVNDITL